MGGLKQVNMHILRVEENSKLLSIAAEVGIPDLGFLQENMR